MCAIVGLCKIINDRDLEWLNQSCNSLRHRGPDSDGKWIGPKKNIALGHRRLSIIDTNDISNQPFISNDSNLAIVFNGEIYNYLELRQELQDIGFKFRTNSDTEVLLYAYKYWGEDCLNFLNGMWAFAIFDQTNGHGREKLFISRDRAGEKPLYYIHNSEKFEFASELKGLRKTNDIDLNALNHYLALGNVPGDLCISSGVKKLPPAYAGIYDFENGNFKKWRYWQLPAINNNFSEKYTIEDLADQSWNLLTSSVKLRLRSDVPIGVFLSGGLDSSLVTAAAVKESNQTIKTFTVSIPGDDLDEKKHAQLIADHFHTDHHVLPIENPSLDILDDLTSFIDEPIADSSILPSFLVSRMTRNYVTVALGGDGGDELFGGYDHYQNALRLQKYLKLIPNSFFKPIAWLSSFLPAGTKGRNLISSLREGTMHSTIWGTPFFDLSLRKKLFKPSVLNQLGDEISNPELKSLEYFQQGTDQIDKMTRRDFHQKLPDEVLFKVDRNSMANGLEVRAPFLDFNLIEHAFKSILSNQKVTLNERRKVQNSMGKKYLPKNFELNRKQGFSVPMDKWMTNISLKEVLLKNSHYFNEDFVNQLIIGQSKNKTNGARLFALMMLNKLKI